MFLAESMCEMLMLLYNIYAVINLFENDRIFRTHKTYMYPKFGRVANEDRINV